MAAAMAELWETAKHAISSYTGLSPATFFTLLVVAVTLYHFISGFLAPPPPPPPRRRETELEAMEPLKPPVQLGEVSEEVLSAYDGSDPSKPLLMAIKSQIYDVTQSRMFYGPGGPYALFAGKDASRALAKMSFEQKDLTGDISGLGPFELEALQDWEYKFMSKYTKVGTVKKTEDASCAETSETAETASTETASAETASEEPKETPVDRAEAAESKTKEAESEGADAGEDTKVDHSEEPKETPVDRAEAAESKTKEAESEGADAGEGTKV